jgi:hypothetical protein
MQPPSFPGQAFWGVSDPEGFQRGLDQLVDATKLKSGWYTGDNLIAFGRTLGFLDDRRLMAAWKAHAQTPIEQAILWRTVVTCWAARQALRRDGDLIECGCYKGTTSRILLDALDLGDRRFFLYDLFEHDPSMPHHAMAEHGPGLYEAVKARFATFPNVQVVRGSVPESFAQGLPDKIAFALIDMNNAPAEIGALAAIAERLVPGAVIVLDDYGALPYRAQHQAEKAWFAARGIPVLELPTSQGVAIW